MTERQIDRETERQRDRETDRQRDRETERQRDRLTEGQRNGDNTTKIETLSDYLRVFPYKSPNFQVFCKKTSFLKLQERLLRETERDREAEI